MTVEEKKKAEDKVKVEVDKWNDAEKAIAYLYLNNLGVSLDKVDALIRGATKL